VTAGEFRRRFPFDVALARYIDLLVTRTGRPCVRFTPSMRAVDQGSNAAAASPGGVISVRCRADAMIFGFLVAPQHREARHPGAQALGELRELL